MTDQTPTATAEVGEAIDAVTRSTDQRILEAWDRPGSVADGLRAVYALGARDAAEQHREAPRALDSGELERPRIVGGRMGAAIRRFGLDSPEAIDARRTLAASKISAAIQEAVADSGEAQPLKADHLALLVAQLEAAARA